MHSALSGTYKKKYLNGADRCSLVLSVRFTFLPDASAENDVVLQAVTANRANGIISDEYACGCKTILW